MFSRLCITLRVWRNAWPNIGREDGEISASNSLIGSSPNDSLCSDQIDYLKPRLPDGQYVIASPEFDDGQVVNAAAFTWAETPLIGRIDRENSVIGSVREGGEDGGRRGLFAAYDFANRRRRRASRDNLVTVMTHSSVFSSGFDKSQLE